MATQSSNPPETISLGSWKGMNQGGSRGSIEDDESFWLENLIPLGPGNLRAMPGPSAAIVTVSGISIYRIFTYQVFGTNYAFLFCSDSSVLIFNLDTNTTVSHLSSAWSANPLGQMDLKVWNPSGGVVWCSGGGSLGLFAWDGTLHSPGSAAPSWVTGGATTNLPGSLNCTAMEVYGGRLWIFYGAGASFSAPNNAADFSTANGGGSFPYQGDQLVNSWNDVAQSSNFLYMFGDSSINSINNVQTSGTPPVTTFINANVDPQTGHWTPRPVGKWGRAFILHNASGLWALYGGAAEWISQKLINLLATLPAWNLSTYIPAISTADIFNVKCAIVLLNVIDYTGTRRPLLACWNGSVWFLASQNITVTSICTLENVSLLRTYATDGTSFYQLFAAASSSLQKIMLTKRLRGKNPLAIKQWKRLFIELQDNSDSGVSFNGNWATGGGGIPGGVVNFSITAVPSGNAGKLQIVPLVTGGAGIWTSLDIASTSPDFTIERVHFTEEERSLYGAD